METILSPEAVAVALSLLAIVIGGLPIMLLTAIFVQVAKWVRLLPPEGDGWLTARRLAVIHSLALGALWVGIQFWPVMKAPATIILLGLYGALFSALCYEQIWTPIAEKLGLRVSTSDFQERLE